MAAELCVFVLCVTPHPPTHTTHAAGGRRHCLCPGGPWPHSPTHSAGAASLRRCPGGAGPGGATGREVRRRAFPAGVGLVRVGVAGQRGPSCTAACRRTLRQGPCWSPLLTWLLNLGWFWSLQLTVGVACGCFCRSLPLLPLVLTSPLRQLQKQPPWSPSRSTRGRRGQHSGPLCACESALAPRPAACNFRGVCPVVLMWRLVLEGGGQEGSG